MSLPGLSLAAERRLLAEARAVIAVREGRPPLGIPDPIEGALFGRRLP